MNLCAAGTCLLLMVAVGCIVAAVEDEGTLVPPIVPTEPDEEPTGRND